MALLLSNFGSSSLSAPTADNETNKIAEAFNRFSRFSNWIKATVGSGTKYIKNKLTNQISIQPSGNLVINKIWTYDMYSKHCKEQNSLGLIEKLTGYFSIELCMNDLFCQMTLVHTSVFCE